MMNKKYTILEEGKDNKVLVKWDRGENGVEYSVHTLSLNDELIWGHYFMGDIESAVNYFKQYKKDGDL